MNRKRKAAISSSEISVIKSFPLGGHEQKVLIEGASKDLPVVLTLHGGPGSPVPFCVGSRGLFPEITGQCILVSWDQYGCGVNNAVLDEGISISDFVQMTEDLIRFLREEFHGNKLFLFGMSWGSVLAARAAADIPDMIDGVVIYGQVLRDLMRSPDAASELLSADVSPGLKARMEDVLQADPFGRRETMLLSKWIRKYTQGYQHRAEPKVNFGSIIRGILTSPDYTFKDFIAIAKNGYIKNQSIMRELSKIDLSDTLAKITVPYHIVQGDADIVTSTAEISKFIAGCDSENMKLSVVKTASHIPGQNGMAAVMTGIAEMIECEEEIRHGADDR